MSEPILKAAVKPQHAPQTAFAVIDGMLQVGGVGLERLALRVGSTPFYAYDRAQLTARVAALRAVLPADLRLHYSMKANPMPALVQHMARLVDGIDVASGGELAVALDAGMAAAGISIAGPGKSQAELTASVAAGICINLESFGEMARVAALGVALGIRPRVALRINPDFELKSSGMRMGGGAKPFGIDVEQAPLAMQRLAELDLDLCGLQLFAGSQSLNAAAIMEAHRSCVALALQLLAQASTAQARQCVLLTIGSGFGIPYFPGDQALQLDAIGANLAQCRAQLYAGAPQVALAMELGRYLVGEAGVYVARVVDRKVSRGEVFLVTDGGLHQHLAASGNFGQVIRKNYPVAIGNRMDVAAEACEVVSVVGPLCTPLDVLAARMALAPAREGDLVVVFQSGAYGLSASPTAFLGHPAAREVLV